jgi:hypothetical protein
MGSHLEFTGAMQREHGVLPTRITNRLGNASDLSIHGTDLSAAEITAMITTADKLTTLNVSGHALTGDMLHAIAKRNKLQEFRWSDAGSLSDGDAVHFSELDHLRVFHLGHADITSAFAATCAIHRHLWSVAFHDCLVDDEVTATLTKLTELRVLSLARSFVTGATLGDLARTHCAELTLDGCELDTATLGEALGRLPTLTVLSLDDTPLGDDHVHFLIGLPDLATLSLRNTRITDQALGFFAFLPQRTRLRLAGTAVTDAGLALLKGKRPDLVIER